MALNTTGISSRTQLCLGLEWKRRKGKKKKEAYETWSRAHLAVMRNLTGMLSASVIAGVPSMMTAVTTMNICALLKKDPQSQRHSWIQRTRSQPATSTPHRAPARAAAGKPTTSTTLATVMTAAQSLETAVRILTVCVVVIMRVSPTAAMPSLRRSLRASPRPSTG